MYSGISPKIMITYCQITYTIPWLMCEQLPYSSKQPQFSWIQQRDKSKIPLLTSTYKYFLPQHSFSTLPSSIPMFISPAAALTKNSRTPAAKASPRIFKSSTSSSSSGRNGCQLHRAWGQSIPILSFLYSNPLLFCKFIYLAFFPFSFFLLIFKL